MVTDLEKLVRDLVEQKITKIDADYRFLIIREQIEKSNLYIWTDSERARCYFALVRLATHGLAIKDSLITQFSQEPAGQKAHMWWEKAQFIASEGR